MNDAESIISSRFMLETEKLPLFHPLLTQAQSCTCHAALQILNDYHSVLICEETGTGKTWVAAAIASCVDDKIILIAPAHLLSQWDEVMQQFAIPYRAYSYQMASLDRIPQPNEKTLWIVDEAHYLKNPATQRYRTLHSLMAGHRICLLTATPVSMGVEDLTALARLCGYRWKTDERWICSYMRALMPKSYVPALKLEREMGIKRRQIHYQISNAPQELDALCHELLQISWPVLTDDGLCIDASILRELLIHRLMSHRTACLNTIIRLERYYRNCHKEKGRCISRVEFRHMMGIEGRQMLLPFKGIFGQEISSSDEMKISRTLELLKNAKNILENLCSQKDDKLEKITQMIDESDSPIILFSQYADTVCYFAQALRHTHNVAAITSSKTLYRGYDIQRSCILSMFDPNAQLLSNWKQNGLNLPKVLICSDALSCGHNFQRARRMIHLDKPWNPVILHQREGRIVRKGQNAEEVEIDDMYVLHPPEILKRCESSRDSSIARRQILQNIWHQELTAELHIHEAVIIKHPGIPGLWGKLGSEWFPISHHSIHPEKCSKIMQTTVFRAFESSLIRYRKLLSPAWKKLKDLKHHSEFQTFFEKFSSIILTLILTPWVFCQSGLNDPFSIEHLMDILWTNTVIPAEKLINPAMICDWIQFYPEHDAQSSHACSQVIHKFLDENLYFLQQNGCQS